MVGCKVKYKNLSPLIQYIYIYIYIHIYIYISIKYVDVEYNTTYVKYFIIFYEILV